MNCAVCVLSLWTQTIVAGDQFTQTIQPIVREHCLECHSTAKHEGDLDLERFSNTALVKQQAEVWQQVLEQLALGEMPPAKAPALSSDHKQALTQWIRQTLDEVALERAGDPGPVILRRLSNHEYTYTLQDLTGVPTLHPACEFPVDGAAGEGFTNTGAALVMSPALLQKYLAAAKEISQHCVLLPHGIRFSSSDSPQDWTNESLAKIREFYARYTTHGAGTKTVAQGISLDTGTGDGLLPLAAYLSALQGTGSAAGLNAKYLEHLRTALTEERPSLMLDPLRAKFKAKQLTVADIEPWQKSLWRFTTVGHIGKLNGPQAWQEPVAPLAAQQEFRVKLTGDRDQTLYLITHSAGDGTTGDEVVWENPRLVIQGRPDLPLGSLTELVAQLQKQRAQYIAGAEACLAALIDPTREADPEQLAAWREYLGFGSTGLEPLLSQKLDGTPEYRFIKGWTGDQALSVLANASDATVRIPGLMKGQSIATHPSPTRAAVIAWRAPDSGEFQIAGDVVHAHPECGNGITWTLEVRRGAGAEVLARGESQRDKLLTIGPFEKVPLKAGQVVALVIGPRDGNHSCDLTAINLKITTGSTTWDLARDVAPDILAGNPHGAWHFLSQPATQQAAPDLPAPLAAWRRAPSPELAAKVREYLEADFPLHSPLLSATIRKFRAATPAPALTSTAPAIQEITIPAPLARDAEFVVTGKLAPGATGSVQLQVSTTKPTSMQPLVASESQNTQQKSQWSDHQLVTQHTAPILVNPGSEARQRWETAFAEFRSLFPIALCYARIVPVDEVVTLTLFHREDDQLRRLMLSESETRELDQLWDELYYVSEAPLKQVTAFEQLWQYATQDADPKAFEPLREPIKQAASEFVSRQKMAEAQQKEALLQFAARAWRRPLTEKEISGLKQLPPRLMLVRVLTSPTFLYRSEQAPVRTGPVNDWELATRLSYFLWSSLPDEELRAVAASGELHHPEILAKQARRMLQDAKIRRLATEFGCQWLHVRDVATLNEKSERHFPSFVALRADMQEEVTRFFIDLFQNNHGVLTLLDADHTFVNQNLANHYGLEFRGEGWQRVTGMQARGRGGILGFSATLAKHAGASRTSAILRGTWLSEVVLGDKLPNPPQGVPVLPDEAPAELTERQLIERHSSDARCSNCHRRIDPYGFALEGFDAIGRSRVADTKTKLADGTEIEGVAGLREYLLTKRRDDFLQQFNRKLLGYALGRSVQLSDQPLIQAMCQSSEQRVGDIVELIVRSPQFREVRGRNNAPSP
jgi:hypothetical protein